MKQATDYASKILPDTPDLKAALSAAMRAEGVPHSEAQRDSAGKCLTCGLTCLCPGVHTLEEIREAGRVAPRTAVSLTPQRARHTPGPWDVRHESIDPDWAIVCASGGRVVANVNAETGPMLFPSESVQMPRDANARLIAAAPDMLAALELAALCVGHYATLPHARPDAHTIAASINHAISKAKGL
jgi:hypothetical protein